MDAVSEMRRKWREAINDWLDEVEMLASEEPDIEAVRVMTEELMDAAPVVILLMELEGANDGQDKRP